MVLPAPVGADQRDGLARRDLEVEPAQHLFAPVVEHHVAEADAALDPPRSGRAPSASERLGVGAEHLEDALRRRRRLVHRVPELGQRLRSAGTGCPTRRRERHQRPEREPPELAEHAPRCRARTHADHHELGHASSTSEREYTRLRTTLQRAPEVAHDLVVEGALLGLLGAERLDHLDARQDLHEALHHLADLLLAAAARLADARAEHREHQRDRRRPITSSATASCHESSAAPTSAVDHDAEVLEDVAEDLRLQPVGDRGVAGQPRDARRLVAFPLVPSERVRSSFATSSRCMSTSRRVITHSDA